MSSKLRRGRKRRGDAGKGRRGEKELEGRAAMVLSVSPFLRVSVSPLKLIHSLSREIRSGGKTTVQWSPAEIPAASNASASISKPLASSFMLEVAPAKSI